MNFDRPSLNFLNEFEEHVRIEGEALHREGCVVQIFGNAKFVQAKVEVDAGKVFDTTLSLVEGRWLGTSSSSHGNRCAALVATMMARIERGEDLPATPNEVGNRSLPEILEDGLNRPLTDMEFGFLEKLEKRFRKYLIERKLFDHDLVRLNPRWEVTGYEPLQLWQDPPENIIEFWNYVAYAFDKRGLKTHRVMAPVTDLEGTRKRIESWEREREIGKWEDRVSVIIRREPQEPPTSGSMRLLVKLNEAILQWRPDGASEFVPAAGEMKWLLARHDLGALSLDDASALLWSNFLSHRQETGSDELRLEEPSNAKWLGRLFKNESLRERIVTLDEQPFLFMSTPLQWRCVDADSAGVEVGLANAGAGIELVTSDGDRIPHTLRLLPGVPDYYLSDEAVFVGPRAWMEGTEVQPRYEVPEQVLASESGVEFLAQIEAELPESLKLRVQDETMHAQISAGLSQKMSSADTENVLMMITASDGAGKRREVFEKDSWKLVELQSGDGDTILRFNRRICHRMPALLQQINATWEASRERHKVRVTKQFPERFAAWAKDLPPEVTLDLDEALQSLLADPLRASLKFEIVGEEIDWFDLKVVLDVEGQDLSPTEIRALVAARGDFVRMKDGGWLRLQLDLDQEQMDAVNRLGLDPFDLGEESHRMHALQLADPSAKEVFDPAAWNRICDSSERVKMRVMPAVPASMRADLRPYQVEGFHFLAYLTTNHFGGILADDMGLGKTVQSLTWLCWLRESFTGDGRIPPTLVICPKSVLDVWAGECRKFAPDLEVQVLRTKEELDLGYLNDTVDILVMNYSQMRVNIEQLRNIKWLAVVLDEGQQIKNPDSKAARASRELDSRNRLVLSGTPIENRLLDVWSLMAFAMPGVLGDRKYFRDRFDRRKDPSAQTRLSARLRPFMIRRTKGQVALDLPPRTEEDVLCKMEDVQEQLYRQELERIQKTLLGFGGDEKELRKNSFVVLQGLMRLRQICCHPGLIDAEHSDAESAKMNALFYLLNQLREEGHKALVFSQFTSMLDIIRERMEEENLPFNYLTGQTKDRQGQIEEFQSTKEASVFLLSLKAGGSGLNLTSASYVILYDPWWNPAVENQAIDRTHRIGQANPVIAYRLIMRDSVEEKIRRLQNQKSQLANDILGEESFTKNLELKDLEFIFSRDEDMEKPREKKKKPGFFA